MKLIVGLCFMLLASGVASAHGGGAETRAAWTFDPWIVVPLLVSGLLYVRGLLNLQQRSAAASARRWQGLLYGAGWLSLAGALVSPLHWLGERLFTAHMIEHEIIMAVAAPLLVLARPGGTFLWAFPAPTRRVIGRLTRAGVVRGIWLRITRPMTATVLHGVAIWIWHVPAFFDATVTDLLLHRLQHVSFFATAVIFWWSLLWRSDPAVAAGELFLTMIHTSILGALMVFAPRVLYGAQTWQAADWGLTPLEDQQLAGLVMWVPVGTVYAGAAIAFVGRWVRRSGDTWKADDARAP
jgi:cytochrome c oxidase assembly factor CtaG